MCLAFKFYSLNKSFHYAYRPIHFSLIYKETYKKEVLKRSLTVGDYRDSTEIEGITRDFFGFVRRIKSRQVK